MQVLVLASGSQYRAQLLHRLNLPFHSVSPDIDESAQNGESPATLARRLAREKAHAPSVAEFVKTIEIPLNAPLDSRLASHSASHSPSPLASSEAAPAIIIASDQVAAVGDLALGKPGIEARAVKQLQAMSGKAVVFHTSLHMLCASTGQEFSWLDKTVATLRTLSLDEINRYIAVDKPFDCAGSFKMETSGISLFDSVTTDDPTALIGLPMIAVCRGLRALGVPVP